MDASGDTVLVFPELRQYRIHILIFLLALFLGLTFSHPELLLNDEWITVNQLYQLNEGHQILFNEGKYGFTENGTMNAYFAARGNRLAYSLFLPLLSLPALRLVGFLGNNFVFFILYLWTGILLALVLSVHYWYPDYSRIGGRRWTPAAAGSVFILFFLNLFWYSPFTLSGGPDSFPEAVAVVFTNNILLAITGVLIYEILRTLFKDPDYPFFGTVVCLFSSSYIFWAGGCKDHILTVLLFSAVLLYLIKFQKTCDSWYLPPAFLVSGLLAWSRPELALWIFIIVLGAWLFAIRGSLGKKIPTIPIHLAGSPFFTVIGAIPFFLNNILITGNPLLPPNTLYFSDESLGIVSQVSSSAGPGTASPFSSLIHVILTKFTITSANVPVDLRGILFQPANGSMGLLMVTPLFLVMALLAFIRYPTGKRIRFSKEEKTAMALFAFMAIAVFFAYASNVTQLNISRGIAPDIRYLSPVYIPLTLIGLIIMSKAEVISGKTCSVLLGMLAFSGAGIPVSIYITSLMYTDPGIAAQLDAPLSAGFIFFTAVLVIVSLIVLLWQSVSSRWNPAVAGIFIAGLCAIPFIWQIDISVRFWGFAAAGQGYPAWIPVIRILYTVCSAPLIIY